MWQNFTAKNFRCFHGLLLTPLARVNLIAGKNNTGKTPLLEAIHIHSHPEHCKLLFDIHSRRGMTEGPPYDAETARWLFYDGHAEHGLELINQSLDGTTRTLQIWFLDATTALQRFPPIAPILNQPAFGGAQALIIMRTEEHGKEGFVVGTVAQGGITWSGKPAPWRGRSVYLGSASQTGEGDLQAFSEVESANRQEEVLASLRLIEPRLRRLSLLLLGGKPVIHGDVGLSRLVPIPLMGEGMRRLLSIVLAIVTAPGGRVLIDEIENGLHHSVLARVWQVIADAAERADAQVFATTHSYECIAAAHQAFSERPTYDLRLHRLDRTDGEIRVATYDKDTLETATDMSLEVR
ncbi:MAG: ATP-binding protein [Gemmataceae bacterium]|nr:ATP-binding protein [Gemmataceae bacterium]